MCLNYARPKLAVPYKYIYFSAFIVFANVFFFHLGCYLFILLMAKMLSIFKNRTKKKSASLPKTPQCTSNLKKKQLFSHLL